MTKIPDWTGTEGQDWDSFLFGGFFLPGKIEVAVEAGGGIEKQKAWGKSGAYTKDNGPDPGKVQIKITLLSKDDLDYWNSISDQIKPPQRGSARPAYDILHPACEIVKIRSVVIDKIKVGKVSARSGLEIVLLCTEFNKKPRPQKKIARVPGLQRTKQNPAWTGPPLALPPGPSDSSPTYR